MEFRSEVIDIIGVPLDLGAGRRGVDMGPSAFRIANIGHRIASLGCELILSALGKKIL
jgi:arginase